MASWGPFDMSGKSAVVTGGSEGIGFGIARRFVEAGANVLIVGRREDVARGAAERLAGRRARPSRSRRM